MELIFILFLIFVGLFAGCMSGLLGVGGGFVFAPAMFFVLQASGVPEDAALLTAFGTSLAAALPTVLTGALSHTKQGNVIWRDALIMGGAGILTGFLGGTAATYLPVRVLTILFAAVLIVGAVRMVTTLPAGENTRMKAPLAAGIGGISGFFSGLLGVGGGTILVPLMTMLGKFSMKKAAATSSAAIVFITLGGIGSYLLNGYFDLLMWVILVICAVPAAAVSSRIRVSDVWLRRMFAVLMAGIALHMLGVFEWITAMISW
ncbi:MAG: sulfite exporter TauE/SafE family protein [Methanocorpusculum sp.]|nr:sulfite exporter TauE/SafE family protein [Methanocorpusculum sp.]